MHKFAIYSRTDNVSLALKKKIKATLLGADWVYDDEHPEIVIVLGGDGKMLRAIHKYMDILDDTSFIGVNTGTLGFFTDYDRDEADDLLNDLLKDKEYKEEVCSILDVTFYNQDSSEQVYSVNELRIEHPLRTMTMEVYVDGVLLEKFNGNGACISSPMGSTGYSRSLGGAVIDRELPLLQFHEVAPVFNSKMRALRNPLIIDGKKEITITSKDFNSVYITTDYFSEKRSKLIKISIKLADKKVHLRHYNQSPFLGRLKDKII